MSTDMIARDNDPRIAVSTHSEEALTRLQAQLDALDPNELSKQNIDPDVAAARALGAVPILAGLHETIQHACSFADLQAVAELEDRAHALLAANARYRATVASPEQLAALGTEALESRTVLASVCAMLVSCNLLKREQVPVLTGGHSYRFAASDSLALVELLKANWPRIQNKVPVTMEHLERLRGVSEEVMRLVGVRDQMPERANAAANVRQRALTLVDRAYDEARRVVTFLRWHEGDVDQFLPPLRTHTGTTKHEGDDAGNASNTDGAGDSGTAGAAGGAGTTGGATHTLSSAEQFAEAAKVFAPPPDAKVGGNGGVATSVPRSKPFADA